MSRLSIHQRGKYLADAVLSASDGIVTTFAVVAGSGGASLSREVVLILGFANLFADGFSMASGNYMAIKSEEEYEESKGKDGKLEGNPIKHAIVSFFSFNVAGLIPLVPFLFKTEHSYAASTTLVGISLFMVGFMKSFYTKHSFLKSGVLTLFVGGFAAFVAYAVGFLIDKFVY
jgi:vacuolar iron transporter family protein